jgi:hypothetical protein
MLFPKMDKNGQVLLLDTTQEPTTINILQLILKLLKQGNLIINLVFHQLKISFGFLKLYQDLQLLWMSHNKLLLMEIIGRVIIFLTVMKSMTEQVIQQLSKRILLNIHMKIVQEVK